MRTDNDWNHVTESGWSTSADSVNVTQTASQGWFWASPWSKWESEAEDDEAFLTRLEPKRYAQPVLLFLPLALGRWLTSRLWRR